MFLINKYIWMVFSLCGLWFLSIVVFLFGGSVNFWFCLLVSGDWLFDNLFLVKFFEIKNFKLV